MTNLVSKLNNILEHIVENYSTFEIFISKLKEDRESSRKLIYDEEGYNEEAWNNVVQIDTMLENLDILLGKVKLEDIQEAARTFKRYESNN